MYFNYLTVFWALFNSLLLFLINLFVYGIFSLKFCVPMASFLDNLYLDYWIISRCKIVIKGLHKKEFELM